jgi:predicted TIM-barrel fold metal-dependent hydrolase
MGSQKKVFEKCLESYPKDTKFIVLPMDMAYMEAGRVRRAYKTQIQELADLKEAYPDNIIPFFHVDPRRKGVVEMLKNAVENQGFMGVKLYPPLGYFPYDKRLDPIYEYCQQKNIPVITHCSPSGAVHYKGNKATLEKMITDVHPKINIKGKSVKELCSMFTHPVNYKTVMKKFPDLRICLAHFGSDKHWERYLQKGEEKTNWFVIIKDMLIHYPNLYTDISFTLNQRKFFPLLKEMLCLTNVYHKILFASDYYMVEMEADEKRFGKELRAFLGEPYFNTIAVDNPKKFLGL